MGAAQMATCISQIPTIQGQCLYLPLSIASEFGPDASVPVCKGFTSEACPFRVISIREFLTLVIVSGITPAAKQLSDQTNILYRAGRVFSGIMCAYVIALKRIRLSNVRFETANDPHSSTSI